MKKGLLFLLAVVMMMTTFTTTSEAAGRSRIDTILTTSKQLKGTPYRFGGTTPKGFDCSGFVRYVYKKAGVSLPRSSASQYASGKKIVRKQIKPGDLVFFSTYKKGVSHAGIYIGSNSFIHAADNGVVVSSLSERYYKARFVGVARVVAQ